jgi:hypothetical protein
MMNQLFSLKIITKNNVLKIKRSSYGFLPLANMIFFSGMAFYSAILII